MQHNLFKPKEKEHREIVISDEVVRNSKLFCMIKEKMMMRDAFFFQGVQQARRSINRSTQEKQDIKTSIAAIKNTSLVVNRIFGILKMKPWS